MLLTSLALIAVVPLICKLLKPVTVSTAASPRTASPAMLSALALPATVPKVVTVVPVNVVSTPRVTGPV